ncbi:Bsu YqfO NIF3/CutA domain [Marinobacterium lacunae]|uniref:Bsu YqfO NIF3/CutA domain n=1 Tax=Marinobacterium lacunae TaxID=1232683 RepID=A0A081G2G6_9GAMM|nr:YqfO family protein [Marinobacterium lacunae]KEA64971.1 Bsu YqfO NIF3/CutA domain [Marinobacterium lacunae]
MFKLCFFVPDSHLETVKQAIFEAGAGRIGDYDRCCWQIRGIGQFRPLEGADPHLGKVGEEERVDEWKVELVCEDDRIQSTLMALRKAHPYEEVAYDLWRLIDPDKL